MRKQLKKISVFLALTIISGSGAARAISEDATNNGAPAALNNSKVIKEFHCQSTLQQSMLDLGRQAGFTAMVDDELKGLKIEADYVDLSVADILKLIAAKYKLAFEAITPGTILVSKIETLDPRKSEADSAAVSASTLSAGAVQSTAIVPIEAGTEPEKYVPELKESKKAVLLQGGIEHHESLSTVPMELRAGAQISATKMKAMEALVPDNMWTRLPNWAAGSWKCYSQTAYYRYSYKYRSKDFDVDTFMNKGAETMGHQKDRKGDLWEWQRAHYWTVTEGEHHFHLSFHREAEASYKDEKQFTIHFIGTRLIVDKVTRKIVRTCQMESIQTYTCPDKGIIRCKSSIKVFDENGLPESLQKSISYRYKIKEYEPWNYDRGEDIRKLFKQYLTMHGLSDLIPTK